MKSQFVTIQKGLRIHTLVAGAETSPPVILLHGYPANCQLWRRCIPALAERFRVYAPDLPGHGKSDKPLDVDYDLNFLVGFLLDFCEAMSLERVSLVAHDFGGMVGLGFAVRHPERVARFVVMDTGPYAEWPFLCRLAIGLASKPFFARWMLTRVGFALAMKLFLVQNAGVVNSEVVDIHRAPWIEDSATRQAFSHVVGVPPVRLVEPRERLRSIAAPTLILWAEKDRVLPASIARELQGDIPNAELATVPDCGHFLHEEQPELIVEHLARFLGEA